MGGRQAWPALLLTLLLTLPLAGCDLLADEPGGARAVPPRAATVAVASGQATPVLGTPRPASGATPTPTATPGRGTPSPTWSVTPTSTITPTPTPAGTPPTPRPAATGYRRYASTLFPYAIDYLETWRPIGGGAHFAAGRADLLVGERRGTATNTVTIFAQPQEAGATAQLFLESSLAELAEAGIKPTEENERVIDGAEAYVFSYTIERDGHPYHITQAIFVRQTRGWVVTLTTTPEDAPRLQAAFTHMLNSFQGW